MNSFVEYIVLGFVLYLCVDALPQSRIIGGSHAEDDRHLLRIESRRTNYTKAGTGSFITKNHALTSATQVVGFTSFLLEYKTYEIIGYVKYNHPDYNPETLENDIGIIVSYTITDYIESVIALPLPSSKTPVTDDVGLVTGFGLVSTEDLIWAGIHSPQSTFQKVIKTSSCKSLLGTTTDNSVQSSHFCAMGEKAESSMCLGDEGAGFIVEIDKVPTIVGVLSFVTNFCDPNYPAVYTQVSPYVDWIKEKAEMV